MKIVARVIIDPGHGGRDPGSFFGNYREKNWTLDISLYMANRLDELGFEVSMTRDADVGLTATDRTDAIRASGATICISNHINAGGGLGAETIHSIKSDGRLARMILDELVKAGQHRRRVFSRESAAYPGKDYYYMHRLTGNVQTVIVEYGFIDNPKDRDKLAVADYRIQLAEGTVKALCEYTKTPYLPKDWQKINTDPVKAFIVGIDGERIAFPEDKAILVDGRWYFEAREITERADGKVIWHPDKRESVFDFSRG